MTLEEAARNYSLCLAKLDGAEREARDAAEQQAEATRNHHTAVMACERAKSDLLTAAAAKVPEK